MVKSLSLKYHALALRLLGHKPQVSAKAILAIRACEEGCGVALPAALREWYTLEGAVDMLAQREGACGPASLEGILEAFADAVSTPETQSRPRIVFYGPWDANTGYEADLILDGSDDPPILIDLEMRQQAFSKYVLDMAWWKATLDVVPSIHVGGRDWWDFAAQFGPTHLNFLTEQFEELPREPRPFLTWAWDRAELRGFRFFRGGWRLAVATKDDQTKGDQAAAYDLMADTEEELFRLYEFVPLCHGVPLHLCPVKPTLYEEMKERFLARFPLAQVVR